MESFHQSRVAVRGFTLVEMMVVLIIITFITSVAITGQSSFSRSLILTNTAYTVAFSIREAQSLGLSSRNVGGSYDAGYGIRLSATTPTAYVLFADTSPVVPGVTQGGLCPGHTQPSTSPDAHPGDCLYDPSANPSELVRTYSLMRGYRIVQFCGLTTGNQTRCSGTDFDTMHITFMRPSTDAVIFGRTTDNTLIALTSATIRLRAPDGASERCVMVSKVGLISVGSCP